jgi:hypothetical protein
MTYEEWEANLAVALAGTDWVVKSATITEGFPYAFAALQHRGTQATRVIKLPLGTLPTPETRAAEIRRQLIVD